MDFSQITKCSERAHINLTLLIVARFACRGIYLSALVPSTARYKLCISKAMNDGIEEFGRTPAGGVLSLGAPLLLPAVFHVYLWWHGLPQPPL